MSRRHPQDLLDKADCVVVFPSVLKAASLLAAAMARAIPVAEVKISGDRGRTYHDGLEGGSFGFKIGGEAQTLSAVMNDGASGILSSK